MSRLSISFQPGPQAEAPCSLSGRMYRAMILNAPIPVMLLDSLGRLCLSNRKVHNPDAPARPRCSLGAVLGCTHHCGPSGSYPLCAECTVRQGRCSRCPAMATVFESLETGEAISRRNVELWRGGKAPEKVHLEITCCPIEIDGALHAVVYFQDVTEQHCMEESFASLNEALEETVTEKTAEIQQLLEQKRAFVNQLGHDLRTPLTPLIALLPLLASRVTDAKGKEILDLITRNTRYMNELVNKTLDLIRLDHPSSGPVLQRLSLRQCVAEVLDDLSPLMEKKDLQAENCVDAGWWIQADPLQLRELFLNILGNAVKFMPRQGQVQVLCQNDGEDPAVPFVRVGVADTGIGMSPTQLDRIFDEFYKADPSRHDRRNAGLGLAICKRIVTNHGGRIWACSDGADRGTTIWLTLPRADAPAGIGPAAEPKTILLAN